MLDWIQAARPIDGRRHESSAPGAGGGGRRRQDFERKCAAAEVAHARAD